MHLGFLPKKIENLVEFRLVQNKNIPFVEGFAKRYLGCLLYVGRGKKGEEIYLLATGKKPDLVIKTLKETLKILGEDRSKYLFVNSDLVMEKRRKKEEIPVLWGISSFEYNKIGEMVARVQKGLET
jgi:ribonucleotide monophosphatase NagD (HAD superfamily)